MPTATATSHLKDGGAGNSCSPTGVAAKSAGAPPIRLLSKMLFCSCCKRECRVYCFRPQTLSGTNYPRDLFAFGLGDLWPSATGGFRARAFLIVFIQLDSTWPAIFLIPPTC